MIRGAHVLDASDSDDVPGVLDRFITDVAVDDYAHVPTRDAARDLRPRRPSTWLGLVVSALVGIVIVAALLNTRLSTDERQATRAALIDRVQSLSDAVAARQVTVDQRSADVQALQDRLLAASDAGPARAAAIAEVSGHAGTAPMSGQGVVVTVNDAPDAAAGSLNRVLDRDLQDIVNALWRDGAAGIAINEVRLTGTTAIRAAGEAILVNYQPLIRPFVIATVGGAQASADDSGVRGRLSTLSADYGLATDLRTGDVALPAGEPRGARFASTSPADEGGADS